MMERGRAIIESEIAAFRHLAIEDVPIETQLYNVGYSAVSGLVAAASEQAHAGAEAMLAGVAYGLGLFAGSYNNPSEVIGYIQTALLNGVTAYTDLDAGRSTVQ